MADDQGLAVGRYFATEDEMECSIIRLVESGEVQSVRISTLPMAWYENGCRAILPKDRPGTGREVPHARTARRILPYLGYRTPECGSGGAL